MKKSIFIITVLAFILFACSQIPPKPVSDNFTEKFAGATKVKWEQEEENEWEAEFKMNDSAMSACFDNSGNWLNTEAEIKEKDLPANVLTAIKVAYPGWKIESVESIESPDFKGFELGIEKGKEELEIMVTASGEITVNEESEED